MKSLTIGQLSHEAGINPESVRFYEAQSLLPEPPRSQAGYRMYSLSAVLRVRFIKKAQELGFSLKEIKELLLLAEDQTASCANVRDLAQTKVDEISRKIRMLEAMKRSLTALAETCPGAGPVANCSILESIGSNEAHHEN
jgi:MerR family mercuric resistance operon transcriptional regulator